MKLGRANGMLSLVGIVTALFLIITGCGPHDAPPDRDAVQFLQTSQWRLEQLDGKDFPVEAAPITLQLMPEVKKNGKVTEIPRFSGSTGVNQFSGTYTSDAPGSIHFSPLATTRRAGPPEAMEREAKFLASFARVTHYRMHGDMMSMGDGTATLLVWRR